MNLDGEAKWSSTTCGKRRIETMRHRASVIAAAILMACTVAAHDNTLMNAKAGERSVTVLRSFPLDPKLYNEQTAALVTAGIPDRYGHEEWAAVVLTHEFHQHVGIYTVLGAKMAVRARQLLEAPMRAVKVVAETGRNQPLSCTVDGLQAGLGSTLGQNLIEVPEADLPTVAATFNYKDRRIRLALTPVYAERIAALIREAKERHGDLTPEYFEAVEAAAYKVWAEFDRDEIFSMKETPASAQ
jgi:pyrimidine-specific ribonucleoside hydrolase